MRCGRRSRPSFARRSAGCSLYAGIAVGLFFAISRPVTTEFNQALTWLSYNYAGDQTVEAYPVFILYAGVLIDNLALFLLVGAGLVLWSYLWIPSAMLIATRAMFAWSFDRVMPDKLSAVHSRYNSPWVAVLVVAVIGELFLILYHVGVFQFLTPALAYYFVFWLVALCGVVFPFLPRTRALLEGSAVDWRIAGIPVMSICGVVGLLLLHHRAVLHADERPAVPQQPAAARHDRAPVRHPARVVLRRPLLPQAAGPPDRRGLPGDPARVTAGAERTIFYVADIHGSDVCFRKWLNAARFYGADVLVIGGDLTGKVLLPIYPAPGGNGSWTATWRGRPVRLETRTEVDELIRTARDEGSYGYVTTVDEVAAIQASPDLERSTFTRLKLDALADWMRLADQRLADGSIRAVVMAGNDDPPEIDAVLATSTRLEDVGGEVVEIAPGIHMASRRRIDPDAVAYAPRASRR